jgi:FkbM family methyltransferase
VLTSHLRRFARNVQHDLWPTPEEAVLQELERRASREPRRTAGHVSIAPYQFEYADAMSAWPQWDDIFVHDSLAFETGSREPRILDCGANIGIASMYFTRRYPHARITAFEADPSLAAMCRRNLAANGLADVEVKASAVWTANGTIEFVCEGTDSGAVASLETSVTGARQQVPAERLRDSLNEPIDLLKLDIEGAELAVLEDCRDRLDNVRAITIDLHEFNPAQRQTGRVFELLAAAGFLFDMRALVPLPWRAAFLPGPKGPGLPSPSPFPDASLVWVATVRAWRR